MSEDLVCKEFVELVTEYLEEEMTPELRARVERHLEACGDCREYLEQVRATIRTARSSGRASLPPEEREKLLRLFREWAVAAPAGNG